MHLGLGLSINSALRNQHLRGDLRASVISALFGNGEQGALYDPSDLSTLYQDSAGTTPVTADGDPVGRMEDLSGNGNHATQSTTSAKPLYRTDGTLHWLEFDGFDDTLLMAHNAAFNFGQGSWYSAFGVSRVDTGTFGVLWGKSISSSADNIRVFANSTNRTQIFWGDDSDRYGNPAVTAVTATPSAVEVGIDASVPEEFHSVDGTEAEQAITLSGTGSNTRDLSLMSDTANSGYFVEGNLYGFAIRPGAIGSSSRESVRKWLASKTGVTL